MSTKPRFAKAHSQKVAEELLRVGWTLRQEFRDRGDIEPYEYLFEWLHESEPVNIDESKVSSQT